MVLALARHLVLPSAFLHSVGAPDEYQSLTATEQDIASIDVAHARRFAFCSLELGLGYEQVDDIASGNDDGDARVWLQWQSR